MAGKTLYDKLWDEHLVREEQDGTSLLYIDRHLVHEVTSPQAFEGLRLAGRKTWRTDSVLATPDHNVPTTDRALGIEDPISRLQVETLDQNCVDFGITEFKMDDIRQGIVHVIGPEEGAILPGMTVVCGDSHTSTHGAVGALAFGIGTSEVEHVLATQCLIQKKSKNMLISVDGPLPAGVTAKDMVLAIIGEIGTAGGTGYAIEFAGQAVRDLSVEGRLTLCNMTIEAGARAGMVAVDEKTIAYQQGRPYAPTGEIWNRAVNHWRTLVSDEDAVFDQVVHIEAASIQPQVTWGPSPEARTAGWRCAMSSSGGGWSTGRPTWKTTRRDRSAIRSSALGFKKRQSACCNSTGSSASTCCATGHPLMGAPDRLRILQGSGAGWWGCSMSANSTGWTSG